MVFIRTPQLPLKVPLGDLEPADVFAVVLDPSLQLRPPTPAPGREHLDRQHGHDLDHNVPRHLVPGGGARGADGEGVVVHRVVDAHEARGAGLGVVLRDPDEGVDDEAVEALREERGAAGGVEQPDLEPLRLRTRVVLAVGCHHRGGREWWSGVEGFIGGRGHDRGGVVPRRRGQ